MGLDFDNHPKLRPRSPILPGLDHSIPGFDLCSRMRHLSRWETLIHSRRIDNTEVRLAKCEILATRLGKGEPGLARDKVLTEQLRAAKVRRRRAGREFSRNSHLGNPEGLSHKGALRRKWAGSLQSRRCHTSSQDSEPHRRVCCVTCVPQHKILSPMVWHSALDLTLAK